jgi:hypothetical protein
VRVTGFKPQIDSDKWRCITATHSMGDGVFTSLIECENESTASSDSGKVQDSDPDEN